MVTLSNFQQQASQIALTKLIEVFFVMYVLLKFKEECSKSGGLQLVLPPNLVMTPKYFPIGFLDKFEIFESVVYSKFLMCC